MVKAVEFEYTPAITAVSKNQYDAHLALYKGYIDKANQITEKLWGTGSEREGANSTYSVYRGLKEGASYAINGCILHELYFENLGGEPNSRPMENTSKLIDLNFGYFDAYLEDLRACCKAARGWCISSYEYRNGKFVNIMLDSHDLGNVALASPILLIDMYEHAYFYDYTTEKSKYIDAVINNINWKVIEDRVKYLLFSKQITL
ncbi:superoxide dismutase [Tyzzerella sp. OttesenSCG-928-J15]|nr:superoxide dismutase [Tyzzerella sp. OttesenSCG-928-J15]